MDRFRRTGPSERAAEPAARTTPPPASSRLTVRARKNRRRPASLWSRMPRPAAIANACGRALRRSLPAIVATGVLAAAGGGVWLGYRFITTSPRFAITSIEVHGTSKLSAGELRDALPVKLGDNVFTANLDAITGRLRQHPWIASATAHRILPDTVVVEIHEHTAGAVALLGEPYLVDPDGHPFKRVQLGGLEAAGLPVVTGVDRAAYRHDPATAATTIQAAVATLARWRAEATRPAIGELHVDPMGGLVLRTYDRGASIELGSLGAVISPGSPTFEDALAARLETFDAAWAALTDLERARARTIHLDARSDHVTVAFAKD